MLALWWDAVLLLALPLWDAALRHPCERISALQCD
jgi:hypothetical protein